MNNRNHRQILIEQLRRQSIQKRTQALKEAVQKQAMNAPIAGASSSGGGSSSLYPDRVDIFIVGQESVAGFACNTKDMYNDGDTPIYYGEISIGGGKQNVYLYWNGVNWGLDNDLNPPYQAAGPTTKNNLYGTYLGIGGGGQPDLKVSAYSQAASIECPALPGGETMSIISDPGNTKWAWDGIPTSIGGNQWTATGIVSGFALNNSPETTLTGDFLIGYDGISDWSLRNNGPMTLGPFTVSVLSIPTGTVTGAGPDVTLNGSFDTGTISGTVIYNT